MKNSVRVVFSAAAVLLVLSVAGFAAGGFSGTAGSENDPLVTLSYINEVFTDYVKGFFRDEVASKAQGLQASLEPRIAALEQSGKAGGIAAAGQTFQSVSLRSGQELFFGEGAEVLLRTGSAYVVAEKSSCLVDTSGADNLSHGMLLEKNHMYFAAGVGCGLCADGDAALLVRGNYSIE